MPKELGSGQETMSGLLFVLHLKSNQVGGVFGLKTPGADKDPGMKNLEKK